MVDEAQVPFYYHDCPGGFELMVMDEHNQSKHNESWCSCETKEPRVVLCEDDQDSVVIEASTPCLKFLCSPAYVRYLSQMPY